MSQVFGTCKRIFLGVFIISPSKCLSLEKNKTVNLKKTIQMLLNFLGGVLIKMKDKRNLMGQDKVESVDEIFIAN